MICVDANILIAALDSSDQLHRAVSEALVSHNDIVALNITWAEALVHPYRTGKADHAKRLLAEYGVGAVEATNTIAFRAAQLRSSYGTRNFPMLDALVIATGIETDSQVLTADAKWPEIDGVDVQLLTPST